MRFNRLKSYVEGIYSKADLEFHLDRHKKGHFVGWAKYKYSDDKRVTLIFKLKDQEIARIEATELRPSLLANEIGDGAYGFDFQMPDYWMKKAAESGDDVSICNDDSDKKLTVVNFSQKFISEEDMTHLEHGFLYSIEDTKNQAQKPFKHNSAIDYPSRRGHKSCSKITEIIFGSSIHDEQPPIESLAFQPKPKLCNYLSHIIQTKSDRTSIFNAQSSPSAQDNFYLWYLTDHAKYRAPLKIPLSHHEINYLNELLILPGCHFSISRFHFSWLINYQPETRLSIELNDKNAYQQLLARWVLFDADKLNLEDALIPKHYFSVLSGVPIEYSGKNFPITVGIEHIVKVLRPLESINLDLETHRLFAYIYAISLALKSPQIIRLIPDKITTSLLKEPLRNELQTLTSSMTGNKSDVSDFIKKIEQWLDLETIDKILLQLGYDLIGNLFTSIDECGNRMHAHRVHFVPKEDEIFDIQIIGPMQKASGLGQASRLSALALSELDLKLNIVDFSFDNPQKEGFNQKLPLNLLAKSKINLIHLNAESLPALLCYYPDVFSNAYNIGYFFWELSAPDKCHRLACEILDEIWVSSEYGVSQYQSFTDKPVTNVGMSFQPFKDIESNRSLLQRKFGLKDEFVFLLTFDSFSFPERKNPLAAIQAFRDAFTSEENVKLVIKTHNDEHIGNDRTSKQLSILEQLQYFASLDSRINVFNETLPHKDLLSLISSCDCYVSLHRSEGFGFGMIEAMSLGVPVIATGYSGNLEFCNDETSWLVPYSLKNVEPGDYVFVKNGQKWADPSISAAANCMKEAYERPDIRNIKKEKAKDFVLENFSMKPISARYNKRIQNILEIIRRTDSLKQS